MARKSESYGLDLIQNMLPTEKTEAAKVEEKPKTEAPKVKAEATQKEAKPAETKTVAKEAPKQEVEKPVEAPKAAVEEEKLEPKYNGKHPGGRKPLPTSVKKQHRVMLLLSDDIYNKIINGAQQEERSLNNYITMILNKHFN